MRIQTFTAHTMQGAMDQVREALGEDAIILSSKQSGGTVQVRAAVEAPAIKENDQAPLLDLDIEQKLQQELRRRVETLSGPVQPAKTGPTAQPLSAVRLAEVLKFHGISNGLAGALRRVALAIDSDNGELALASALDARMRFAALPARPKHPLLLVGPPGVGKTSSLAKLMARAALGGVPVQVFTTDTVRSGAEEQLKASAEITKTPVTSAASPEELASFLKASKEAAPDVVTLIDTPGVNPFSSDDFALLKDIIAASEGEPVLVAAAGADGAELADNARAFKSLGARLMLATRLDSARRLGGLLMAADTAQMKLSHVSLSPYVADGLKPANPMSFARWLLEAPKALPAAEPQSNDVPAQANG